MLRLRRPLTDDFNARRLPRKRSVASLLTQEQMRIAIERETARADRSKGRFAAVLFELPADADGKATFFARRLTKTVLNRVRATDDVGWYDENRLCALLPDTGSEGALRFARAVCSLLENKSRTPVYRIYCYPGDNNQNGSLRLAADTAPERLGQATNGHAVNGHAVNGNGHAGNGKVEVASLMPFFLEGVAKGFGEAPAPQVHKLEHLLVRPLPLWKRALDLIGATTILVCASPFMIAAAIAIKLTSKGPVIFKQPRAGLGGKPFTIYKFRTMCVDAEALKSALRKYSEQDGPAFKMKNDPRVTRVGTFLRKTSIDELPQLFNVLKGDMTLVGPRPLPISESENCDQWQRRRLDVTPGITCIWQVKGRSTVSFADWVRMDVSYIRRRGIVSDLMILAQTLPAVLMRRGAR